MYQYHYAYQYILIILGILAILFFWSSFQQQNSTHDIALVRERLVDDVRVEIIQRDEEVREKKGGHCKK